jgi:serine/threonine protein kinase
VAARHFGGPGAGRLLPDSAVVGSYRIERVLGVGGQAVVYLARHERLSARLVALKVPVWKAFRQNKRKPQ